MFLLRQLKKAILHPFSALLYVLGVTKCYSQLWEDIIIDFLILKDNGGKASNQPWFYIDIWWNDPVHANNTYFFYKKWWQGINVEPNKRLIRTFHRKRPRDTNLEVAIGKENGELTFYSFEVSQVSTCDPVTVERYVAAWHKVADQYTVPVRTLESICDEYVRDKKIDILSVDVEWLDMAVLESNNWDRYRPTYVIVETVEHSKDGWVKQGDIFDPFFQERWYVVVGETGANTIYKDLK